MKITNANHWNTLKDESDLLESRNRIVHDKGQKLITIDIFDGSLMDGAVDFTMFKCKNYGLATDYINDYRIQWSVYNKQGVVDNRNEGNYEKGIKEGVVNNRNDDADEQGIPVEILDLFYTEEISQAYFTTEQEAKEWIRQNIELF